MKRLFQRRNGAVHIVGPRLTSEELEEFKLRYSRVMEAFKDYQMLDEAHRAWLREIGARYNVGTLFEIDMETGALTAKERPSASPLNDGEDHG